METMEINQSAAMKLAEIFGTTIDKVTQHLPEFLAKYACYVTFKDFYEVFLYAGLVAFLVCTFFYLSVVIFCVDYDDEKLFKAIKKTAINVSIGMAIIMAICRIVPLIISPEIVGLNYIIEGMK